MNHIDKEKSEGTDRGQGSDPYVRESLADLKRKAGLTPYRNRCGELSKQGKEYKARCPWHDDRTPSLTIYQKDGQWLWQCFPCDKGGDAIAFVMRKDGVAFKDAMKTIRKECGFKDDEPNFKPFNFNQTEAAGHLPEAAAYLGSRGIPMSLAERKGLGVVDFPGIGPMISMPYDSGIVKMRALEPVEKAKKFRHLKGTASADLLFWEFRVFSGFVRQFPVCKIGNCIGEFWGSNPRGMWSAWT